MKLIIIKTNLKTGLSAVQGAAQEGSSLPILKTVLLSAQEGSLKISATNLEVGISASLPAKVSESGEVAVPAGLFFGVIQNLQSERISLEKKDNNLEITTENYKATIQGLPAEDFPIIPQPKQDYLCEIKGVFLKEAIEQTSFCAYPSEVRPELGGVMFSFSDEGIKVVATDSFRLAEKTIGKNQYTSKKEEGERLLVPIKTINELQKIITDNDLVKIYHEQNQVFFQTDKYRVVSRLIEGAFPDYAAILPKKISLEAVVGREELVNALKLASVFSGKTNEVRLKMGEAGKALEVLSADQATGENAYLVPLRAKGEAREVVFNWRYLQDGIKTIKGPDVFLGINEDNKPALIKSPTDGTVFYIVMPILKN